MLAPRWECRGRLTIPRRSCGTFRLVSPGVEPAIAIPQTFVSGRVEPARIRDFLARAEALGFHSAWVVEQILGRMASLEPVALLAHAAAHTTRRRLCSAVLLTALRSPIDLAKMLATIDQLSGGGLVLGGGLGHEARRGPDLALVAHRRRAGTRLAEWFGAFYGKPELAAQVSVWGDAAACIDGLAEVVAAGARLLLLNPVFDEADQLERLATTVVPKLPA